MKNLLNTIVFKSVALFAMVLLVAFAVTTSLNPLDQSNDIGGKNKDIIKHATDTPIADIGGGGKGTSTTLKEAIGGSKGIKGEFYSNSNKISDIGGRSTTLTGNYSLEDIGGRNGSSTLSGEDNQTNEIGGRSTNSSDFLAFYDIGGRKDVTTGNLALNDIGGSRDHVIIRRIPIPFTSEIGGKGTTIGQ